MSLGHVHVSSDWKVHPACPDLEALPGFCLRGGLRDLRASVRCRFTRLSLTGVFCLKLLMEQKVLSGVHETLFGDRCPFPLSVVSYSFF